ncbi:MAG: hypothetical protein CMJ36_03955 [Phycisphaerae bacterium]|nr:hypothetical protein [Phycisphaerae bacterium]
MDAYPHDHDRDPGTQDSLWPLGEPAEARIEGPAVVLVATSDAGAARCIKDTLVEAGHRVVEAANEQCVREQLAPDVDLLLVDAGLCSGILELIEDVRSTDSWRQVIVWSPVSDSETTISAVRSGACDYLHLPERLEELVSRVDTAIAKSRATRSREERLSRLTDACEQLRETRDAMSDQVDVLCGDLASAYTNIKDQLSLVEMMTEFRTLIGQELDVEQMLRTSLEYMLEKIGPTNGVVYLREAEGDYGIGAYVNYEWQDRNILQSLEELGAAVCPQMTKSAGLLKFDDAAEFARCDGVEAELFESSEVVACTCMFGNEPLAILVFFRKDATPFTDEMAGVLDALRSVLAEQLARILRVHKRSELDWPDEQFDESDWDIAA